MAKRRMKRYSRRTSGPQKRSRAPLIILCVAIFVVLCLAVSVVIGILLKDQAENAMDRPRYDFEKIEYQVGNKTVKSIEGYHFSKGSNAYDYYAQGIEDFSFCLRHYDGSLDHYSSVAEVTGFDAMDSSVSLDGVVDDIKDAGGRACGYFYVTSFDEQDDKVREVYKAYELALISEMADSGIDEIILLGINVTDENIGEVEEFLAKAASDAKNVAIGAAVSWDTLMLTEKETYHAARIKNSCDFLALDLCHMTVEDTNEGRDEEGNRLPSVFELSISRAQYYLKTYRVRLIFSAAQSSIYRTALELGIVDFQIVGK
ncbi:MAG: hypothetical protein E7649_07260 [Ruminococcaceae bacterium]|nr:hypothetical protein [Oscillospiraceae bacterium]